MKFEKTLATYFEKIKGYSEAQFLQQPDENSWSLGQVYVHTILANDHFFLKQADMCLNKQETERGRSKNKGGKLIFLIKGFPKMKFKMPKSTNVPPRQPENIESIRVKLECSAALAKAIEQQLESYDKDEKTKHPAFGYLNAKEWYLMSEMHFRHHLRQLKQIEKKISA